MGVKILGNSHAKWLEEKNGRVTGVCINEGVLHADEVVIAAGAGAAILLKSIGLSYVLAHRPDCWSTRNRWVRCCTRF